MPMHSTIVSTVVHKFLQHWYAKAASTLPRANKVENNDHKQVTRMPISVTHKSALHVPHTYGPSVVVGHTYVPVSTRKSRASRWTYRLCWFVCLVLFVLVVNITNVQATSFFDGIFLLVTFHCIAVI